MVTEGSTQETQHLRRHIEKGVCVTFAYHLQEHRSRDCRFSWCIVLRNAQSEQSQWSIDLL